CQQYNNSPYSF
nr:immunoglobulin light chain junction region [Macaca mulatta]MOV83032.1 immunoglobulin light chain junction region [Macaca mulatta]MOV85309.1 immunoglobulin light chain junction region [Macaca mulatta]MOV86263.1 immunoglobulin light chain junction region [Macaca mulatta]MOW11405.1 immunoglobulin light chain junction region [Macaca mulatta]